MDRTRSGSRATSDDDNPASYFARPDLTLAPVPPRAQDFESGSLLQDPTFDLPHRGKKKRAASLSRLFGHVGRELRHDITDMRLRRSASHSRARTRSPGDDRPASDSLRRSGSSPERDGFESESPQNSAPRGLFSREARRQSRERQQQQQATISSPRSPSFSRRRADSAPAFPRSPTWRDDPGTSASRHRDSTRGAWDGSNGEVTDSGDSLRRPKHSAALTTTSDKKLSQTSATQTGPETPDSSASRPHVFIPRASSALDDPVTESISPAGQPQQSLFKATFSPRQLARLQRASKQVERHDRKIANKGLVGAEFKVALGLFDVLNKEKKEQRRARGQGKAGGGALEGERHGSAGLAGLAHQLEQQVEHRLGGVEHDLRESGHRFEEGHGNRASVALGVGGGAAALVGLVGAGYEMWQQEMKRREEGHEQGVVGSLSGRQRKDSVAKEARDCAKTAPDGRPSSAAPLRDHEFSLPHLPASLTPRAVPPHATTPYLSSLTPAQHHLVQHAAAALLLKDHTHGNLHEKLHRAVGGFDKMVQLLEVGMEKAWTGVSEHAGTGIGSNRGGGGGAARRPKKLFGTPLPVVTHHEGVDSFHGADPHGTVRIPEFIDHCITALMQADVTVEGILRKNGKVRLVREIMEALDSNGGNDAVIDLAALDPVTLADLFKRFLAALPDPVLTSHLFKLFVACSHIHNVNMRRRCMHLVLCLMPKVNRDVLEVVFLFLEWLSQYAHITVKDGNQMNLTAIATVMAPTLLRPTHRDPKPTEINAMIAAILSLLEDQHFLHAVPLELAQVLHLHAPPQKKDVEGKKKGLEGGAALLHALAKVI